MRAWFGLVVFLLACGQASGPFADLEDSDITDDVAPGDDDVPSDDDATDLEPEPDEDEPADSDDVGDPDIDPVGDDDAPSDDDAPLGDADSGMGDFDLEGAGEPCTANGTAGTCLPAWDCGAGHASFTGHCPGPAEVQCCVAYTGGTCVEEALVRPNRGRVETSHDDDCPLGMVRVTDFCIDKFEASLIQEFASGGEAHWSPYHNPGTRVMRAVSLESAVPQSYISGTQAANACAQAGKYLCNDDDWKRACQGSPATTYPYGASRQAGWCADARSPHPVVQYFGTSASWIWGELGNACVGQQANTVSLTGSHEACVSDDGVLDMMGNLHEWTADVNGTFRGGFYVDTVANGNGCLYATTAHNTEHWDYSTGFRCCADLVNP